MRAPATTDSGRRFRPRRSASDSPQGLDGQDTYRDPPGGASHGLAQAPRRPVRPAASPTAIDPAVAGGPGGPPGPVGAAAGAERDGGRHVDPAAPRRDGLLPAGQRGLRLADV